MTDDMPTEAMAPKPAVADPDAGATYVFLLIFAWLGFGLLVWGSVDMAQVFTSEDNAIREIVPFLQVGFGMLISVTAMGLARLVKLAAEFKEHARVPYGRIWPLKE